MPSQFWGHKSCMVAEFKKTFNSMQFNHEFTWLVGLSFGLLFLDPNLISKRAGKF